MKKIFSYALLVLLALFLIGCGSEPAEAPCEHQFSKATCTKPQTCKSCGATQGAPLGHNFEVLSYTPSTCKEKGHVKLKCSRCPEVSEYDLDLVEHSYCDCGEYLECSFCHEKEAKQTEIKNIILIIGDGMGIEHVAGGQLYFNETFEFTNFNRVFVNTDCLTDAGLPNRTTDSAAGGTAIATGVVTKYGYVAKDGDGNDVETILDYAKNLGMKTGVITSGSPIDATPAVFTAHSISRNNTAEIIASQMTSGVDFICGETQSLVADYFNNHTDTPYKLYTTLSSLSKANKEKSVYGTLNMDNVTITDMTKVAIDYLSNPKGFVLMVEQEMIDYYSHSSYRDFNKVCNYAKQVDDLVDYLLAAMDEGTLEQTAIIITADHETGDLTVSDTYQLSDSVTVGGRKIYYSYESSDHSCDNICMYYYNFSYDFSSLPYYRDGAFIKNCDQYTVMKYLVDKIRGLK